VKAVLEKSHIKCFANLFTASSEKFDEMRSLEGVQTLPVGFIRKVDNTVRQNILYTLIEKIIVFYTLYNFV